MPLWFGIAVLVLLAIIAVELFGIEGNIHRVAEAIWDLAKSFKNLK